jgi:hypothetical protein
MSDSSKACKKHLISVRVEETTNRVRPDYIILQAKTPPRFPSRGVRQASPQVIEGYHGCFPFPRLYKLSQTPDNG